MRVTLQLLWKGQDALETALDLISVAERASQQHDLQTQTATEQFVWRQDILRPAADSSQVPTFADGPLSAALQAFYFS